MKIPDFIQTNQNCLMIGQVERKLKNNPYLKKQDWIRGALPENEHNKGYTDGSIVHNQDLSQFGFEANADSRKQPFNTRTHAPTLLPQIISHNSSKQQLHADAQL